MMIKRNFAAILTALAATTLLAAGCGGDVECGKGTSEKDGKCVANAGSEGSCGAGTVLEEGQCVLDNSGCGAGTVLEAGACVPSQDSCGDGTTLDTATGKCVSNSSIECGAGTVAVDGKCQPAAENCAAGTVLDNGKCVIAPAACGAGTALDANSKICAPAAEACGAGLGFTDGKCVPTAELCNEGTIFNEETGLCLPEAVCKEGDQIVNGFCLSPAEALYNDEAAEDINSSPKLELPGEGERLIFTGQIATPTEEADGTFTNDVDKFTFDGEAGQYIRISLQALGAVDLVFEVEGPEGINERTYVRTSSVATELVPARYVYIPYDGEYTVTVQPAFSWFLDLNADGGEGFEFAGTLDQLEVPTATELTVDKVTPVELTGNSRELLSNLYKFDGSTDTDLITFNIDDFGVDASSSIFVLSTDAKPVVIAEHNNLGKGGSFSVTGNTEGFQILVDNSLVGGQKVGYELSGQIDGVIQDIVIPDEDEISITFTADANSILKFVYNGTAEDEVEISIFDADNNQVGDDDYMIEGLPHFMFFAAGGEFTVTIGNEWNMTDIGGSFSVQFIKPLDIGAIAADSEKIHRVTSHTVSQDIFLLVDTTMNQRLSVTYDTGVDYDEEDIQVLLDDLLFGDVWKESGKKLDIEFIEDLPGLWIPGEKADTLTGTGQFMAVRMSHVPAGMIGAGGAESNRPYDRTGYDITFNSETVDVISDFDGTSVTGFATEANDGTIQVYELRVTDITHVFIDAEILDGDGWMLYGVFENGIRIQADQLSLDGQLPTNSKKRVTLKPGNEYMLRIGGGQQPQFNDEFEFEINFSLAPPPPPAQAATGTNNDAASADLITAIPVVLTGSSHDANVNPGHQFWKLVVAADTTIDFTVERMSGAGWVRYQIFNESDLVTPLVTSAYTYTTKSLPIPRVLVAGTYIIKVGGGFSSGDPYTYEITLE